MRGLTIDDRDAENVLAFDLKDILSIIGDEAMRSHWTMTNVEAIGKDAADTIHRLSEQGALVPGPKLLELAKDLVQIVDGTFRAYLGTDESPWLIIHAVDSTAYDVETDSEVVLQLLRSRFQSVSDLPQ